MDLNLMKTLFPSRPSVPGSIIQRKSLFGQWRHRATNPLFRRLRAVAIGALAVLALAALGLGVAELVVRLEPVALAASAPAAPVSVVADERLFTFMAALNAAGYDDENNELGMHPVRQAVRAELAGKNLASLARLRPHLQMCRLIHESQCIHWLLQRGGPPDFSRQSAGWWLDLPGFLFLGMDGALSDFYAEAGIATLWHTYRPEYVAEIVRYQDLLGPSLKVTLAYLRLDAPTSGRVVMLPNLLDSYWRGYGQAVGETSYILSGPAETPNISLVQHEFMHPIINPLVDANLAAVEPELARQLFAHHKDEVGRGYQSWEGILHESVIRAVEVRLADAADQETILANGEAQGFWLVRPLAHQLEAFERGTSTLAEYMPTLLGSLYSLSVESQASGR
jgi:hypothetical protein